MTKFRTWLEARFAEFKKAMRWSSIQMNAVASVAVTYLLNSPDALAGALNALPAEARTWFPPAAGLVLFVLIYALRVYKSKDLHDDR